MSVLDQSYRRWQATPTTYFRRMLVIPHYDALEILSRKAWMAVYFAALLPPIFLAGYVYIAANSAALATFIPLLRGAHLPLPGPVTWASVVRIQLWFIVLFGLLVGPPLATRDFANNAIALYLSKALRRWEYILGRCAILLVMLSLASWIPLVLIFGLEVALAPAAWRGEHAWLLGSILIATVPWMLVVTALVAAVSAHLHRTNLARAALLGIVLVTWPMAKMLQERTGTAYAQVVSPLAMAGRVSSWAFEPPRTEATSDVPSEWQVAQARRPLPVAVAVLVLLGWVGACVVVLAMRVRPVEVVK